MGVFDIREINAKALGSRERSFLQVLTISRKPSVDFNSSQSFISPYSSTRCTIYVLCLSRSSVLTSTSQKRWDDILFTHSLFDITLWNLSNMLQNYTKQLQPPNETCKNIINQENRVFRPNNNCVHHAKARCTRSMLFSCCYNVLTLFVSQAILSGPTHDIPM